MSTAALHLPVRYGHLLHLVRWPKPVPVIVVVVLVTLQMAIRPLLPLEFPLLLLDRLVMTGICVALCVMLQVPLDPTFDRCGQFVNLIAEIGARREPEGITPEDRIVVGKGIEIDTAGEPDGILGEEGPIACELFTGTPSRQRLSDMTCQ